MPYRFALAGFASGEEYGEESGDSDVWAPSPSKKKQRRLSSLRNNIGNLWRRNLDQREVVAGLIQTPAVPESVPVAPQSFNERPQHARRSSVPASCPNRRAIPSLPRPQTFRRQESEKRENLFEVPPSPTGGRTLSVDRRRGCSVSDWRRSGSLLPISNAPSASAPNVDTASHDQEPSNPVSGGAESGEASDDHGDTANNKEQQSQSNGVPHLPPLQIPDRNLDDLQFQNLVDGDEDAGIDLKQLEEEYDRRWILNLSMHFRDKSNREKFFVTYAETPSTWRRLTISLDYRKAPEGSLEADLMTLHYQRDKSFRIYEAIHESLPDIQYFDTVTNLRLETTPEDGQLHIHVREDTNEIVQFPSCHLFQHVEVPKYRESDVEFMSHISGFVYKVRVGGRTLIKKEIPGPDTIDEFLYEVNALDALLHSRYVIDLEGLVTDNEGSVVKGLLISYAEKGSLVDMLYDYHRTPSELPWHRREKWAKQIVAGLSDIHEAGFVQGDFTLSNIVINEDDNAAIIDINRRGCPVGWEPPELGRLIDSGQRISMCIGVKTDIYQLGMVLWAIAEVNDEPERVDKPLPELPDSIRTYYCRAVSLCLKDRPQERPGAKKVLRQFPMSVGRAPSSHTGRSVDFVDDEIRISDNSISTHRSDKEYIDPKMAVTLDDVNQRHHHHRSARDQPRDAERDESLSPFTSAQVTYFTPRSLRSGNADGDVDLMDDPLLSNAPSTSYRFDSSGSWVVGHNRDHQFRGRSPVSFGRGRRRSSPFARSPSLSSATSLSPGSPPARRVRGRVCDSEDEEERDSRKPDVLDENEPAAEHKSEDVSLQPQPPQDGNEEQEVAPSVQESELAHASDLLHADSGFDEAMVEALDNDEAPPTRENNELQPLSPNDDRDVEETRKSPPPPEDMITADHSPEVKESFPLPVHSLSTGAMFENQPDTSNVPTAPQIVTAREEKRDIPDISAPIIDDLNEKDPSTTQGYEAGQIHEDEPTSTSVTRDDKQSNDETTEMINA